MRTIAIWLLGALAAVVVSCVQGEPDRTTVVVKRGGGSHSTVVKDDAPAAAPDTNVDIDVHASDKDPEVVVK
jgi:hypothetical protein